MSVKTTEASSMSAPASAAERCLPNRPACCLACMMSSLHLRSPADEGAITQPPAKVARAQSLHYNTGHWRNMARSGAPRTMGRRAGTTYLGA